MQKRHILAAAVLIIGIFCAALGTPSVTAYAVTADHKAARCGDLGAFESMDAPKALAIGSAGTVEFAPVAEEKKTQGGAIQKTYAGTIAAAYSITTPLENNYYTISVQNTYTQSMTVGIYDSGKNLLTSFNTSSTKTGSWTGRLSGGQDYYIVMSSTNRQTSTGYAYVKVEAIPDDTPDDIGNAYQILTNTSYVRELEVSGDTDYFKVETPEEKGLDSKFLRAIYCGYIL